MHYWGHQDRTDAAIDAAIAAGHKRILVTGPTGSGKSVMIMRQIDKVQRSILYTHRRFLREQLEGNMRKAGIDFGVRASGAEPALLRDVQVSSIQTEERRVFKQKQWEIHHGDRAMIDEAHVQKGEVAKKIMQAHVEAGTPVIGWTATPLDLGEYYDHLIVAATNSECRECGAHVICQTYGPDEPDTTRIKPTVTGEYTENDVRKVMMTPTIFGRVYDWWKKLNPDARPAILFAPGVGESLWFAQEFSKRGVPAAHIDGDDIWIDGETMPSSQEARNRLAGASKSGEVKVVCNRFVMREGIDWPWLYHGIMATVFGSLSSYLQSGGRLLRSHESLDHVVLQDHGGNWWRHGSLNADREWRLEYTANIVAGMRAEAMREKKDKEPITCPECGRIRSGGPRCPACGHEHSKKTRRVMQLDGKLVEHEGDVFKPRRVKMEPDTQKIWERCYRRAFNSKNEMTFNQAMGLFFYENHYYPPKNLPYMPVDSLDWYRKVKYVHPSQLAGYEPKERTA